jgi:ArsR family metal-binding transcriptional regulator
MVPPGTLRAGPDYPAMNARVEIFDLEVFTPPCSPGTERFTAIAHLTADIRAMLPYLNAVLPGAVYRPGVDFLTWRHGEYDIAFHADRIAVGNLEDREAATRTLNDLLERIHHTWARRAELTPSFETPRRPTVMAVYKLLPGDNCRQCGVSGCWSFALKLVASQVGLADCPRLAEPAYAGHLTELQGIIPPMPAGA